VIDILLPELGESVTEGTIIEWRVEVGQAVAEGDIVCEITTDKVDAEIPASAAGVIIEILAAPGDAVEVGQPICRVDPAASAGGTPPAPTPATTPVDTPADTPAAQAPAAAPSPTGAVAASPLARAVAAERGVDLALVEGSDVGGRIVRADVEGAPAAHSAPRTPPAAAAGEEAVTLAGPAAALAGYMDQSLTVPTATSFRTLSVAELERGRTAINTEMKDRGVKLSFTHLIAWSIVMAARDLPVMGTGFQRIDDTPHRLVRDAINLGIAVDAARKDGSRTLLVPVIRAADRMSFPEFVAAFNDMIARARDGKLTADDLTGATITLTNPGGLGTVASVPRLMAGQGTIVACGSIAPPPGFGSVRPELLAEWGVSKVMTVTSTYDHRVIQGAESGQFLAAIDEALQDGNFYAACLAELLNPPAPTTTTDDVAAADVLALAGAATCAAGIVDDFRSRGHLLATLDPLGSAPVGYAPLAGIDYSDPLFAQLPGAILGVHVPQQATVAEALVDLKRTYCGTTGYEIEHVRDETERAWLREAIESGRFAAEHVFTPERRQALLQRLAEVDGFERYLRKAYLGAKTFSGEGVDALIPLLEKLADEAARAGAEDITIGMAHRGRLATITHVVGRPIASMFSEFDGPAPEGDDGAIPTAGDVKYHLGTSGEREADGHRYRIHLAANPSHLEQVNAVVEGQTRALQTVRGPGGVADWDPARGVALVVHGDAAFPGQGVVAETLNLQELVGYRTGGSVHIIANNQVGFTTDSHDSRSTVYASDLARGFEVPIIHVNADDAEAVIAAARLAMAYRNQFHHDVLIDLVGYRRLGHNEGDEPGYTQPTMYEEIREHPAPWRVYADQLVARGEITEDAVKQIADAAEQRMKDAHAEYRATMDAPELPEMPEPPPADPPATAVPAAQLIDLNARLLQTPDGFTVHPKLQPQLDRRADLAAGPILWGHAESLAFASLLTEGTPIRLSGQDVQRGTFAQRHLALHDTTENGGWHGAGDHAVYIPAQHLAATQASLEIHNSPLSEAAVVGFEYGYASVAPEAMVIWEAQYGDFANGAQTMIDQFIATGQAKWGQGARLVLLLPHGYEGSGPEHSSGRIERFLQLAAENNLRVANCSTAAQYFHLLREHALAGPGPLVVFTPKSLLRLAGAAATLDDLATGHFQRAIDDARVADPAAVTRVVVCTGKVFHDIDAHDARDTHPELAVVRLEQLYPFPAAEVAQILNRYPNLTTLNWVQEEPRNMGGWNYAAHQLKQTRPDLAPTYIGRSRRASTSEGYSQAHKAEQQRIIDEALGA